jgi:hypothetical protein
MYRRSTNRECNLPFFVRREDYPNLLLKVHLDQRLERIGAAALIDCMNHLERAAKMQGLKPAIFHRIRQGRANDWALTFVNPHGNAILTTFGIPSIREMLRALDGAA